MIFRFEDMFFRGLVILDWVFWNQVNRPILSESPLTNFVWRQYNEEDINNISSAVRSSNPALR
jgi:hypothetical protein